MVGNGRPHTRTWKFRAENPSSNGRPDNPELRPPSRSIAIRPGNIPGVSPRSFPSFDIYIFFLIFLLLTISLFLICDLKTRFLPTNTESKRSCRERDSINSTLKTEELLHNRYFRIGRPGTFILPLSLLARF